MKTRSFLAQVVVLLILGMLVAEAAVVTSLPKGQGIKNGNLVANGKGPINDQSPVKGQDPVKDQDPVKGQDLVIGQDRSIFSFKRGSCPWFPYKCVLWNPRNKCLRDAHCPGVKKCCEGFCGKICINPR